MKTSPAAGGCLSCPEPWRVSGPGQGKRTGGVAGDCACDGGCRSGVDARASLARAASLRDDGGREAAGSARGVARWGLCMPRTSRVSMVSSARHIHPDFSLCRLPPLPTSRPINRAARFLLRITAYLILLSPSARFFASSPFPPAVLASVVLHCLPSWPPLSPTLSRLSRSLLQS